jgi:hypothetical protein
LPIAAWSPSAHGAAPTFLNLGDQGMHCAVAIVARARWAAMIWMVSSMVFADGIATTVSGFGTVGGTFTSDGHYAYIHNPTEFAGASTSLDTGLDSRIGVQAVVSFDSQWSVTAQEVAKLRGSSDFDPGTEWLYAQYQPTTDLKARLGRVVLPVFLLSDVINVGYAAPWFHAPNDVYDAEGFEYLDGGQVLWRHSLGGLQLNLEATYGQTAGTFDVAGFELSAKSSSTFNTALSLSWGNLLVRYAYSDLNTAASLPLSPAQIVDLKVHDHFHCLGLQYDDGNALLMSEWTKRKEDNLPGLNEPVANDTSWYAAAGWRFGKFTPLAMYSALHITQSLLQSPASYHTWNAILRYDVRRNLDLKLQLSRAQAANDAYWISSNRASNEYVEVYSFGTDFVF